VLVRDSDTNMATVLSSQLERDDNNVDEPSFFHADEGKLKIQWRNLDEFN
jgi:hypothetical protein